MSNLALYEPQRTTNVEWLPSIPSHWDIARGRHLFRIQKRIAGKLGFQVLSVTQTGIKPKDTTSGEGQLSQDYSKYQFVFIGDFVMNHMDLLTGWVDRSQYDGVTSPDYRVFELIDDECDPDFFRLACQVGYIKKLFYAYGQGVSHLGRWRFPADNFKNFYFPKPPLLEQQAAAIAVNRETARIDTLIEKKERFIELLKEKRQALITKAVTKGLDSAAPMKDSGVEWIGKVPEEWVSIRLKFRSGRIIDTEHKTIPFVDDSEYLVARTSDIRDGNLLLSQCRRTDEASFKAWTRRGKPEPGDIMLTREAPAGEACVVPKDVDVSLGQRTVLIRQTSHLVPEFLLYVLYSDLTKDFIERVSMGSTVKHLNMADIPNIPFFCPSIQEQESIVEVIGQKLRRIDQLSDNTRRSIVLLRERRSTLITAAITGQIDLREST